VIQGLEGPALVCRDVHKSFGSLEVLKGISLSLDEHEVVCLIGASGSGKSTLLRCINLLEPISSGSIEVQGREVTARGVDVNKVRRGIGIVFQAFNLFPHMSVLRNVTLAPRKVMGMSRSQADAEALELLDRFGLADKRDEFPDRLSGGQQQRVAIARALVTSPKLLLADEPTGNLDSHMTVEVMALFQELNEQGITIVLVTHEPDVAAYARRIVEVRDGRIVRDHPVAGRRNAADDLQQLNAAVSDDDAVLEEAA
jgi:polar amino acid transport system ATP-binding protein